MMSQETCLRGIALVIDDAEKGPQLVFRYPVARGTDTPSSSHADNQFTSLGDNNTYPRHISQAKKKPLVDNPFIYTTKTLAIGDDDAIVVAKAASSADILATPPTVATATTAPTNFSISDSTSRKLSSSAQIQQLSKSPRNAQGTSTGAPTENSDAAHAAHKPTKRLSDRSANLAQGDDAASSSTSMRISNRPSDISPKMSDKNGSMPVNTISQTSDPFGMIDEDLLAWLFRPKYILCNKVFELEIDGTVFVSYPIVLEGQRLRLFNVVFAIRSDDNPTGPVGGLIKSYNAIAERLAKTLLHEEDRCGYVSAEVRTMMRVWSEQKSMAHNPSGSKIYNPEGSISIDADVKTKAKQDANDTTLHRSKQGAAVLPGNGKKASSARELEKDDSAHVRKDDGRASQATARDEALQWTDRGGASIKIDLGTVMSECLSRSLLARDIQDIFNKLRQKRMAQVLINSWVPLSISLHDPDVHPSTPIRPYHTLLLLKEGDAILRSLPSDASLQLRQLVKIANPLKSFEELNIESGISLAQLFRLAAHLVYWGCGRIQDTLTKHNIYVIHPGANLRPQSSLAIEFSNKFGSLSSGDSHVDNTKAGKSPLSLLKVLSQLSVRPAKVGNFLQGLSANAQLKFIKMLIWLLRHDFLVQLHMYVHLVIPQTWLKKEQKKRLKGGIDIQARNHGPTKMSVGVEGGEHRRSSSSTHENLRHRLSPTSNLAGSDRRSEVPSNSGDKPHTTNTEEHSSAAPSRRRSESFDQNSSRHATSGSLQSDKGTDQASIKSNDAYVEVGKSAPGENQSTLTPQDSGAIFVRDDMDAFEAYRRKYRSFRVGHARGAKGELSQFAVDNVRMSSAKGLRRLDSDPLADISKFNLAGDIGGTVDVDDQFSQASFESAYLASIADDTPVYHMFKRLSPYFHGKHHVEEIMWRETVSRKAIQSVFATYSNVLVSVLHPKVASKW